MADIHSPIIDWWML